MPSDSEYLARHREIWKARPDLRAVYHEFFARMLDLTDGRRPVVEIGSGPGFFKEYRPDLISTDVLPNPWIDHACNAWELPFADGSVGALVMLDTLHHLPKPLAFVAEAERVLQPGGRIVMIEPWITPLSYLLYRYLHHEDCYLKFDLAAPFAQAEKNAFDGNAAIPYRLVKTANRIGGGMRLVRAEPFLGLPYLATLGFKRTRPMPRVALAVAEIAEKCLFFCKGLAATRVLAVWEKTDG